MFDFEALCESNSEWQMANSNDSQSLDEKIQIVNANISQLIWTPPYFVRFTCNVYRDLLVYVLSYAVVVCVGASSLVYAFHSISYLDVILPFLFDCCYYYLDHLWYCMDSIAKARSRQLKLTNVLCSCIRSVYYFSRVCFDVQLSVTTVSIRFIRYKYETNIKWHRSSESFFFFRSLHCFSVSFPPFHSFCK